MSQTLQILRDVRGALRSPSLANLHAALQRALPRSRSRFLIKTMPQPFDYAEGDVQTAARYGMKWELRPNNFHQWQHLYGIPDGVFELLKELSASATHVVDVGANVGIYALNMHNAQPAGGQLFAFEPHPTTFACLSRHLALNANIAKGIVPVNLAVSDEDDGSVGMSSTGAPGTQDAGQFAMCEAENCQITAQTITLDTFLTEQEVGLDLLKVDVEGCEAFVLRGAQESIRRYKPTIVLEVSVGRQPDGYDVREDLHQLTTELGYRFRFIADDTPAHPRELSGFHNIWGKPE